MGARITTQKDETHLSLTRDGDMRRLAGDSAGAITCFSAAIELNPNYFLAYYGRALCRKANGDLKGALYDLEMCTDCSEQFYPAVLMKAECYDQLGEDEMAVMERSRIPPELRLELSRSYTSAMSIVPPNTPDERGSGTCCGCCPVAEEDPKAQLYKDFAEGQQKEVVRKNNLKRFRAGERHQYVIAPGERERRKQRGDQKARLFFFDVSAGAQ